MVPATVDFVKKLPKVELHVHLEGCLLPELRFKLAKKHGINLPQYASAQAIHTHYATWFEKVATIGFLSDDNQILDNFFDFIGTAPDVLRDEEDFYELAMEFFTHQSKANVRYMEIFFNPQYCTVRGLPVETSISGFRRAKADAAKNLNVRCQFIMGINRVESIKSAVHIYEEIALKNRDIICGIGLDGASDATLMQWDDLYKRAKADGFHLTAHVESELPNQHEHLTEAITLLGGGLERLDHGTQISDFPDLMEIVKKKQIGITCCPYPFLGVYLKERHKLYFEGMVKNLFDEGILISLGSDDPPYFGFNYVEENILLILEKLGSTEEEMIKWQENAVTSSWATSEIKEQLLEELKSISI